MNLSNVKDKIVSLIQANLVTAKIFLVLSASVMVYGSMLTLIFSQSLGFYSSMLAAIVSIPKNLLAAYAVRKLFLP